MGWAVGGWFWFVCLVLNANERFTVLKQTVLPRVDVGLICPLSLSLRVSCSGHTGLVQIKEKGGGRTEGIEEA